MSHSQTTNISIALIYCLSSICSNQYLFCIRTATLHLFAMWSAATLVGLKAHPVWPCSEGIWENTQRFRWKKFFLLCTCQAVSEGPREHSVLLLCLCVCVCGGGGSLDLRRQQGCTVRTTKPQRHCYCSNGEPPLMLTSLFDSVVVLKWSTQVIVSKLHDWHNINVFLFLWPHLPELTF